MSDDLVRDAKSFLQGGAISFEKATKLWKALKGADEMTLARRVVARMRARRGINGPIPNDKATRDKLCQQEALLTSKDCELLATLRHDAALKILTDHFGDLDDSSLDTDAETLGIAGGILKRRFSDLGQIEDLRQAWSLYHRYAAKNNVGDDGYTHVNAAFLDDLLAAAGDEPDLRRQRADDLRERLLRELPEPETLADDDAKWFNTATRAEALFGLRRYREATDLVANSKQKRSPWQLETMARQVAQLGGIQSEKQPLDEPQIQEFFNALLPGAGDAARSVMIGKVGLALSGGGFRASFYHLGVLARLAELDVLRHVEVLSCVSGGSIVGACYWLALRNRLLKPAPMTRDDYVVLVREVMDRFLGAVATNLRTGVQPSKLKVVWRLLTKDQKGALDPEEAARGLDVNFYQPLLNGKERVHMDELKFTPADHAQSMRGTEEFHPGRHNWLRAHKVPVLVINSTTVNTGHAWQFTPTWMGESPWAVHQDADSVPRLEWGWYNRNNNWSIELARAVAASACVPGVFAPLAIPDAYNDIHVQLVDGGVHDNQGTVSLLALSCNVLIVSDACGQLALEKKPTAGIVGLVGYANRSMSTLMERIRLANFADLTARRRVGLLRGLMFLHMKAGLDAETVRLPFSQEAYDVQREQISPSGVRKDIQLALAELRTDLDAFAEDESHGLMACGYEMARWAFERDLLSLTKLWAEPATVKWPFESIRREMTSPEEPDQRRRTLLEALAEGAKVRI